MRICKCTTELQGSILELKHYRLPSGDLVDPVPDLPLRPDNLYRLHVQAPTIRHKGRTFPIGPSLLDTQSVNGVIYTPAQE